MATRQAISDTATALFLRHGFDETTLAEVAERAGVSLQTVINYFPQKSDLFFDEIGWCEGPVAAIRARAAGQSPRAAVGAWYLAELPRRHAAAQLAGLSDYLKTISQSPTLRRRRLEDLAALTDAIETALIQTAPTPLEPWRAALQAANIVATITVCEREIARRTPQGRTRAASLRVARTTAATVWVEHPGLD